LTAAFLAAVFFLATALVVTAFFFAAM
jgi:hypothetical protein